MLQVFRSVAFRMMPHKRNTYTCADEAPAPRIFIATALLQFNPVRIRRFLSALRLAEPSGQALSGGLIPSRQTDWRSVELLAS